MDADSARAVEFLKLIRRQIPAARTEVVFVEGGPARVDVRLGDAHCQVAFLNGQIAAMDVGRAWNETYCADAPVALDLPTVAAAAEFVVRALSPAPSVSPRLGL